MKRPQIRNLIQHDGLTQPGRFLEELDPQFAKIDDRTMTDLLSFAWKLSRHLIFYDVAEGGRGDEIVENGSWQELLRFEPIFSLSVISIRTPVQYSRGFEVALDELDPDNDSETEWKRKILKAFVVVVSLCEEVKKWANRLPVDSKDSRDLKIYISQLKEKVEQLLALYSIKVGDDKLWLYVDLQLKGWQVDQFGAEPSGPLPDNELFVRSLRAIFGEMQSIYSAIVNNARKSIETSLQQSSHQAHIGLFLTFLRLLEHNRLHLNNLTGRHLDFYLQKILRLEPKKRQPDSVNLTFTPAKKVDRYRLVAGTAFKGGKNEEKIERLYDLKNEISLSKTTVAELKNIHVVEAGNPVPGRAVYVGEIADSLDGMGKDLPEDNPKWPGFGTTGYPFAELGFVIASPLFRLSEGLRNVSMTFSMADISGLKTAYGKLFDDKTDKDIHLPEIFAARVSTSKGWYDCTPQVSFDPAAQALILYFSFAMDVPPIVDYDAEKTGDTLPLPASWPAFRLSVNQKMQPAAYEALRHLRATDVELLIHVEKVRGLVLGNDAAMLKPDKPFLPFTGQPRVGSTFFIGHAESFAKPLDNISLAWNWVDSPDSLEEHYQNYTQKEFQFTAKVDIRESYQWESIAEKEVELSVLADPVSYQKIAALSEEQLRQVHQVVQEMSPGELRKLKDGSGSISWPAKIGLTDDEQKALQRRFSLGKQNIGLNLGRDMGRVGADQVFAGDSSTVVDRITKETPQFVYSFSFPITDYQPSFDAEPFSQYSETMQQGGLRFRLLTPEFAFGHKQYPKLHSKAVAAALNSTSPDQSLLESLQLPYTPMFENLELTYTARKTFSLSAVDSNLETMLLYPFGYSQPGQGALVADYTEEGTLYIGLADCLLPQNLALLIQLAEGSGDPFKTPPREVCWSYLTDGGWVKFTNAEILRDTTIGFLQSGIIELSLPTSMSNSRPEMPKGKHWLRLTVSNNTAALHDVLAVTAQAGVAVYRDEGHRAKHLATALPAGSVAKMLVRDPAIKTVNQPFASTGGREAESDRQFHTRCSERLRHKDRAVTLWDYEHLILEQFPDIHKVKCLNHTCPESEFSPGNVMLVLLPDLRNRNSRYPLRPAVTQSTLEQVKRFIGQHCSAHVTIHVVNPFYERIAIGGVGHFYKGFDQGIYQKILHQDITRGLTPWLRGEKDIHFGGRIHSFVLLNLVEELHYIDYLSEFTVSHYVGPDDTKGKQVDEVVATGNRSILVSNHTHTIQGVSPQ